MKDGVVLSQDGQALIRFERHLPQPPETVWQYLTSEDKLSTWFPCQIITQRWQAGATLDFKFTGHDVPPMSGTVLELDEPRVLAFTWGEETLRFELTPHPGGGTRLVFTDALERAIAARNAAGWDVCLDRLAGDGPAPDAWKPRFDHYVALVEPQLGAQQGPPAGYRAS